MARAGGVKATGQLLTLPPTYILSGCSSAVAPPCCPISACPAGQLLCSTKGCMLLCPPPPSSLSLPQEVFQGDLDMARPLEHSCLATLPVTPVSELFIEPAACRAWWAPVLPSLPLTHGTVPNPQTSTQGAFSIQCHITAEERRGLLPGPSAVTNDLRTVTLCLLVPSLGSQGPYKCILTRQPGHLPQ